MSVTGNYQRLIAKLDEFIRKYYANQLLRGLIYLFAGCLGSYLLVALLEYYSYFDTLTRSLLFYSFIILNLSAAYWLIGIPALAYYRLGKVISHQKASQIIGEHFSTVKDRLLNTLELHEQMSRDPEHTELILAGINQKIASLNPIPFTAAINLNDNKKYLKFAAFPLAAILIILFAAPSILTESTERLVHHNTYFEKKAPFDFLIQNPKLEALQNEDFQLELKMSGQEIPQDIYLVDEESTYKLTKSSIIQFSYAFKNLQKTKHFHFVADGFSSKEYELKVVPKPGILDFEVQLDYPAYTGRKNEQLENTGDLTIPAGTTLTWNFRSQHTDELLIRFDQQSEKAEQKEEGLFSFKKRALKNSFYVLRPQNQWVDRADSMAYTLTVIPDAYPTIEVQERPDSNNNQLLYFIGQVKDDYGFSQLRFYYRLQVAGAAGAGKMQSQTIALRPGGTQENFFHYWDVRSIGIQPGDQVDYYFEVFDNDGVNGSKSARSELRSFKAPTLADISKQTEKEADALKDKMSEALKQAERFQAESKKLREKLIDKKNLGYEEKKAVRDLIEKQKQLEKLVDDVRNQNKQKDQHQQQYKEQSQNILEKQKQLEDLMEKVLDDKTKALLDELKKLLDEDNKNKTQAQLEQLQQENKNLEKELERALEMFKQMEMERKVEESIQQLDKLAEKQEQLASDTKDKKASKEELKGKQDELNKEFKQVQEQLKDADKENQELEHPSNFDNPEQEQQEIGEEMENSSDQLQEGKNQKASESQKNASQKMKALSKKLKDQQSEMEAKEMEMDMRALRELLDNLIQVSFDQEKVMNALKKTSTVDPAYVQLSQKQSQLKDDLKMVEDSLFALSKRVAQIQSVVNREIAGINQQVEQTMESLAKRNVSEATGRQQYIMTGINNLAVMLSEVFEQMQAQMKQQMEGKGKDGKPTKKKGSNPGMQQLSKMQEQLNKQLEEMKKGMQPGQKPGKGQMSEQLAKMAAQQQAIRNALQQISKEENKDGKQGMGNLDKLAKEMEKTETEIYNKMINEETLMRQKEIMTRLLEAEKAEREREFDNQREAKEGKQQNINYAIVLEEYKKLKEKELELLKTLPPQMNSYYRNKINTYFNQLNQTK